MLKGDTSDLARLQYGGKPVLPEQNSYSATLPDGVIQSSFGGGLSKQLLQFQNAPYQVKCTYVGLDGPKAAWLANFMNKNRGVPFIATILLDDGQLDEFVVQRTDNQQIPLTGFNGRITVTYEVEPAIDTCFADWTYEAYMCRTAEEWAEIFCYTQQGVESWPS